MPPTLPHSLLRSKGLAPSAPEPFLGRNRAAHIRNGDATVKHSKPGGFAPEPRPLPWVTLVDTMNPVMYGITAQGKLTLHGDAIHNLEV